MAIDKTTLFDGPIPGENYTSDTKNYPWHRPPEITDIDKGIEEAVKRLTTRQGAYGLLNSLQAGVTIVQATDMFVTSGIGQGKWTPDFALLLAGPVARVMKIMAEDAGIEYAMGTDDDPIPTISYYKKQAEISMDDAEQVGESAKNQLDTVMPPTTEEPSTDETAKSGFMAAKAPLPPTTGAIE